MGEGGRAARGGLYPLMIVVVAMSPVSVNYRPRHAYRGPKRCLTTTGVNFRPITPM